MPQTNEQEKKVSSDSGFQALYAQVIKDLDAFYAGLFDNDEAQRSAMLCLLALNALSLEVASADHRARAMKRDVEFAKADAYSTLKDSSIGGKKVTESALAHLILKDPEVQRISREQNDAEREAKHLSTILGVLKDAHLTFRSVKKFDM